MFAGGCAIIDIGIALDPDWAVVSAFDSAMMLKTFSTTYILKSIFIVVKSKRPRTFRCQTQ